MPAALAIPLATGLGTAAAGIGGAAIQSSAAGHAADVQDKGAADALAFQKQQAQQDFLNAQAAAKGNWEQWAARQGRLSTLGQTVGLSPFQIPSYVPMQQVSTLGDAMRNYNPPGSSTAPADNRRVINPDVE